MTTKNDYELLLSDDTVRLWLQERDGERLSAILSVRCLYRLHNSNLRWYAADMCNGRQVVALLPNNRLMYLGRFLMDTPRNMVCVNMNGDKMDYRLENLRNMTRSECKQNRSGAQRNSRTGIRGVSVNSQTGKFIAQAELNGRKHYLGQYDQQNEAAAVVIAWRREHMPWSLADRLEK